MTEEQHIKKLEDMGFSKMVGLHITKVGEGYAEGELEIGPQHMNPRGTVHGGCLFTLMDTVGGAAAYSHGSPVATSSSHMLFLRGAQDTKTLRAVARDIRAGRTLIVVDVQVFDEYEKEVAQSSITYFRLAKPRKG